MTIAAIKNQFKKYEKEYNVIDIINKIQDTIYDYELELGNIVCIFIYNKEDYLELSLMTCPNKVIPRIKIEKVQ